MNVLDKIDDSWDDLIPTIKGSSSMIRLTREVMPNKITYPKKEDIFNVFEMPLHKIRLVILGQDPYPYREVPNGKAFAVRESSNYFPRSLRFIRQEMLRSLPEEQISKKDEQEWKTLNHLQEQGVFLLNTALTVEANKPGSHAILWTDFSKRVINKISMERPCLWMLWGKKAKAFLPHIRNAFLVDDYNDDNIGEIPKLEDKNYVLTGPHPNVDGYSNSRYKFSGVDHFKKANQIFDKFNRKSIIF